MSSCPALNHSSLHFTILDRIVKTGAAPTVDELAVYFAQPRENMIASLHDLQDYHGVVLHPKSAEVWVMHPFSLAPTNFWIESAQGHWWGNCAWCSLGAASLLGHDVSIKTVLGGEGEQVEIRIVDGQIADPDLCVHFPIPMAKAWDNVSYTCSVMLVFRNEREVDAWCARHRIEKGDVQPLARIWEFAKVWYGDHLNPTWRKWTALEAKSIFERFGLVHPIWDIPVAQSRF